MEEKKTNLMEVQAVVNPVVRMSQTKAAVANARKGVNFKIIRKVFFNDRTNKYFYRFSVIGVVPKVKGPCFEEITIVPDIGYVGKDAASATVTGRNSVGYGSLNENFDISVDGLRLELIDASYTDENHRFIEKLVFSAVGYDENGIGSEITVKPENPMNKNRLLSFFAGYGGARDFMPEDKKSYPELQEMFEGELLRGVVPGVKIEN